MGKFFRSILALIGFIVVLAAAIGGGIYVYFFTPLVEEPLPAKFMLRFDLERVVEDSSNDNPFSYFGRGHPIALRTFIESVERAGDDPRVLGLVLKVGDADLALSHAEEMRGSLDRFKNKGKFIKFFTDSFGEMSDASALFYLASVAPEIWLQPSGSVCFMGLSGEMPFIKKLMNMVGIKAEFGQRHEYKTAPNMFLYDSMPDSQRESETALLKSMQQLVDDKIAKAKEVSPYLFTELRNGHPLSSQDAFDKKLITHIGYWSEFKDSLHDAYKDVPLIKLNKYINLLQPVEETEKKIALIVVDGEIIRGQTPPLDARGSSSVGSETICKAIREAVKDGDVAAIVLRIDSPGGSYIASDAMWYEVIQAREVGVPVIASLASVAASGGYYLAMGADKIVTNATTITGSIGVYSGKYVLEDLAKKIGTEWAQISTAENAGMMSMFKSFTPKQWEIVNRELDIIYEDFTTKFQSSRDIPAESVDNLARGRVFAGGEAVRLRLADQIGGYFEAIGEAKKMASLPVDKPIAIEVFPKAKSITERVMQYFEDIEDAAQFVRISKDMIKSGERAVKGMKNQLKYDTNLVN